MIFLFDFFDKTIWNLYYNITKQALSAKGILTAIKGVNTTPLVKV
jgi:hypothetical protein